jgi:hypothetical protein
MLMLLPAQGALADIPGDYRVIPGQTYRVLLGERLSSDGLTIHRIYDEYSGLSGRLDYKGSLSYGKIRWNIQEDISLPKPFGSLEEAKKWLQGSDPAKLRLPPNTVVSEEVLNEWSRSGYQATGEYWEFCPKGLVSRDLKADYGVIPKPYLLEGLTGPEDLKINVLVDNKPVVFRQDKPYAADGSVLVPAAVIAEKLGYKTGYAVDGNNIGVVTFEKGPRKVEVSVWWDFAVINGYKTRFEAPTRLSINERVLVPVDLFAFMSSEVNWRFDQVHSSSSMVISIRS